MKISITDRTQITIEKGDKIELYINKNDSERFGYSLERVSKGAGSIVIVEADFEDKKEITEDA